MELPASPAANYDSLEDELQAAHTRAEATIANLDQAISALSEEIGKSSERLTAFETEVDGLAQDVAKAAA